MRNIMMGIALTIAALVFTNGAQAQTFEQMTASFFSLHETSFVDMRVNENKACAEAADKVYGRRTVEQRQACVDDHEAMIAQSRARFTKEIAYQAAVKYKDPKATQLKKELDAMMAKGFRMLDELERKYSDPYKKIGLR